MAEQSKQRKVDAENRQFNQEWTDKWLFVLPVGGMKPMCLICNATVAVVKSSSLKRHYETTHKARFDVKFPPGCSARKEKVSRLQNDYEQCFFTEVNALHDDLLLTAQQYPMVEQRQSAATALGY